MIQASMVLFVLFCQWLPSKTTQKITKKKNKNILISCFNPTREVST